MTERRPLRALLVESVASDAAALVRELGRAYDVTSRRVETRAALAEALAGEAWDLVLSDYVLPGFGALGALEVLHASGRDLPFIIVSGTVGEDAAVEALHAGAHDFIAKGKLARLLPAIERELRDAAIRAERARIQDQLFVADRMASVGVLAAGVGHELNNPLAVLMANLEFAAQDVRKLEDELRQTAAPDPEAMLRELAGIDESMRDARDAAERVRHIARDLRLFARGDDRQTIAIDVRRVVESALRMAAHEVRQRARVVHDAQETPPVTGSEARLGQLVLNLVVHAAQGLPEGEADRHEIRVTTRRRDADHVELAVRDDGPGLDAAGLARLFEPFAGRAAGAGLGLAICQRLVTAMGGTIAAESEPGGGTTIRVVLPVWHGDDTAELVAQPAPRAPAPRRGRILIVDDDPLVGSALRRMLASTYDVATTTTGSDAQARVEGGERYDIILCDVHMPLMSGVDLHDELARSAPDQAARMLFMTGGAFTPVAREFLARVQNPRIDKPVDWPALKALLHNLIR